MSCSPGDQTEGNEIPPRYPDAAGEVTEINLRELQLDEGKRYSISNQVASFSTYNRRVTPLLSWQGKYVHIGIEDNQVIWIAGIGIPDKTADPPIVFYTNGALSQIDSDRRLIFEDGTVLRLDPSVGEPPRGSHLTAKIDASSGLVVELRLLDAPSPS